MLLAEPLLKLLAFEKVKLEDIPEKVHISEEELEEVLDYLKQNGSISYIRTMGRSLNTFINLKVTSLGLEIACGKRSLVNIPQNISQQIINSSIGNVVQSAGDSNTIVIDNSKHYILKQMIEQDSELDSDKKNGLFNILEKFNTLKESGENALELLKIVASISLKYVPLFFGLLS